MTTAHMELYEYARTDLMAGKKILYLHGFASSGQNGTARTLRTLIPGAELISPDIPVEPSEAMPFLRQLCTEREPDLIIGTSMGAMYAELLCGYDRILVNPAFRLADTLLKNNGLGRQVFHNPRLDGETSFLVNKGLIESFRECSSQCFGHSAEERGRVWGLFGIHDTLVDCFDLFEQHYPAAIRFDGEHYLNDRIVLHSLMPVIQRIDDAQEGRSRKTILIDLEDTLADLRHRGEKRIGPATEAENGAVKAFRRLSENYDVYVLGSARYNHPEEWSEQVAWTGINLGVHAWNRLIMSDRRDMVIGDYYISADPEGHNADGFMGTVIGYGGETFRTWDDILEFFGRLGGQ